MRNITAYNKWAVLVVIVVMGFDLLTGLRPMCASGLAPFIRARGIERVPAALPSPDDENGQTPGGVLVAGEGRGGTSKCCCKKQSKCPTIPRSAIASNPIQRFNEVQRQAQSECCVCLLDQVLDHRVSTRGDTALLELVCSASYCFSSPLELTCVLLI